MNDNDLMILNVMLMAVVILVVRMMLIDDCSGDDEDDCDVDCVFTITATRAIRPSPP